MPVAAGIVFTKEHIDRNRFNASSELAEQAVHCLELVSELSESGLRFQFKGGNSLLLIFKRPFRFSIDVDIATDESRETIEEHLERLAGRFGVFTKWERRPHKTKPWLPLASYYLFYHSHYSRGPCSIMLDAQLRRSPYATECKEVSGGGVYTSSATVEVPLPSSIIGDKLLTLGPSTLGIPPGKNKEAQRLKHVFDVARLLDTRPELTRIRESFHACLEHENSLQERKISARDVVLDTVAYCKLVREQTAIPEIGPDSPILLRENALGLAPFAAHLLEPGYTWNHMRSDMATVALCMGAIGNSRIDDAGLERALAGAVSTGADGLPDDVEEAWKIVDSWMEEV